MREERSWRRTNSGLVVAGRTSRGGPTPFELLSFRFQFGFVNLALISSKLYDKILFAAFVSLQELSQRRAARRALNEELVVVAIAGL